MQGCGNNARVACSHLNINFFRLKVEFISSNRDSMRSIVELIKAAGGPRQIAAATHGTPREITLDAVHKWKKKGIPHWHWPVLMRLTDATESEILAANQALLPDPRRSKGSRGGHRRKPRAKRVLAQAAA